jgi:hypothetical protein
VGNNFGGGVFEFGAPPGGGGAQMQLETSFVTPRSTDQSTFRSIAARGERVRADLLVRDPYEFLNLALVAVRRGDFEFDGELEKALFISADRHMGRDAGFPHRRLAFSRNPQKRARETGRLAGCENCSGFVATAPGPPNSSRYARCRSSKLADDRTLPLQHGACMAASFLHVASAFGPCPFRCQQGGNHSPFLQRLLTIWKIVPIKVAADKQQQGDVMSAKAVMENVRRYRAIASLYRQTASFRPVQKWSLLDQAEEWERLAVSELEAYFKTCDIATARAAVHAETSWEMLAAA